MSEKHLANVTEILKKIALEQNYSKYALKIEHVTSGGANYTSELFRATITSELGKPDLYLFIKVAIWGEELRKQFPIDVFVVERFVYTELKDIYKNIEKKHGLTEEHRIKIPKFYGATSTLMNEIVVMEDLAKQGFTVHDRVNSVDWAYAAGAVDEIVKLHSLSFAYEHEDPEGFAKTINSLKYDFDNGFNAMEPAWKNSSETALSAVRDNNRDKLQRFINNTDITTIGSWTAPKKYNVLVHRDYRTSNQMFRTKPDGTTEVIMVDFQTMHGSSPVIDLLYFIFLGTDQKFRDEYYEKLLEYYYEQLAAAMTRLGLDPEETFSKEAYKTEYAERLPFGLAMALFGLPIVTVDAEHAPVIGEDMLFDDFKVAPDQLGPFYVERLNGVVDDFVKYGTLK